MASFYPLKIEKIRELTANAVEITFEVSADIFDKFNFKAGQYITIKHQVDGEDVRRAYSICSPEKDGLSIGVKLVEGGKMSTFLTKELKEGDILEVMPPSGNFVLNNEEKVVAICAGSGITPILSMMKKMSENTIPHFTLVYGNKTIKSTMFFVELNNIISHPNLNFHFAYSREKVDGCFNSRIDKNMLSQLTEQESFLQADGYFLCGPGEMIDIAEEFLLEKGVEKSKIHFERFTASRKEDVSIVENADEIISNITVIMDGDEFEYTLSSKGESILDSAMDVGADVPFSCKGAVCCTCKAKVMEGKAAMDANYSLSEEEVAQGYILTCQAHPITKNIVVDYDEM